MIKSKGFWWNLGAQLWGVWWLSSPFAAADDDNLWWCFFVICHCCSCFCIIIFTDENIVLFSRTTEAVTEVDIILGGGWTCHPNVFVVIVVMLKKRPSWQSPSSFAPPCNACMDSAAWTSSSAVGGNARRRAPSGVRRTPVSSISDTELEADRLNANECSDVEARAVIVGSESRAPIKMIDGRSLSPEVSSQDAKVDLKPLIVAIIPIYCLSETINVWFFLFLSILN